MAQDTIGDFLKIAMDLDDDEIEEFKEELEEKNHEDETKNEVAVIEEKNHELERQLKQEKQYDENLEYANDNMKKIIDSGMESLPDVMSVMTDSQDSRMYTAAANFLKTLIEANKVLVENNKPTVSGNTKSEKKPTKAKEDDKTNINIQVNGGDVKMMSPDQLL